jgi:hypothetical protein
MLEQLAKGLAASIGRQMLGLDADQKEYVRLRLSQVSGRDLTNLNGELTQWFLELNVREMLNQHLRAISIVSSVKDL